jgi:hypothetical protein
MFRSIFLRAQCRRCSRNSRLGSLNLSDRSADEAALGSRLALMSRLETSLKAGLRALLALDLAGVERCTRELNSLGSELTALLKDAATAERVGAGDALEIGRELGRTQARILDAIRLQSAVLKRAQAKLRVLANMLADPSAAYTLPPASGERPWESF